MIRQCPSATASSKTFFAKSTATVVASMADSFRLVALTPTPHEASWHDDALNRAGGVHPITGAGAWKIKCQAHSVARSALSSNVRRLTNSRRHMKIIRPNRATRTYTQHLVGPPEAVFPLLCPVRETDWIDGWDPPLVVSLSGVAEPDCVFTTESTPMDAVWYITRHEPSNGFVEMLKITPNVTACRLSIQLRAAPGGSEADITYCHTSLSAEGDAFVASFTESYYQNFMQEWESRINHYLSHGSALHEAGA